MDCARSNEVLERSEVGAFTMGQEAGSVSEPHERAPSAILFLPTSVSTDDQNLAYSSTRSSRPAADAYSAMSAPGR